MGRANTPNSGLECGPGQQSSSFPVSITCDDGSTMTCYQCLDFVTQTPTPTPTPTPRPCDCQTLMGPEIGGFAVGDSFFSSCPDGYVKGSDKRPYICGPNEETVICVNCYPDP